MEQVLRLSIGQTLQGNVADYAAVPLRRNIWQLNNGHESRIAVFDTPLTVQTNRKAGKRWRTKLFLSGPQNSGLDERTGREVEAVITKDDIIEFSRI